MAIQALQCEQCSNPSKYKCPKCEVRSCSLACVQAHKEKVDCDGLRNKTKYKALDNFSDLDMVNDFRLLEEISRTVDGCRRDKLKRSTRQGTEMMRAPKLPRHLANLQNQAKLRGMRLRYLPPHFSRRVANTSNYQYKTKSISWMVELVFPHASKNIVLDKIDERTKLWKVISDYVEFKTTDDPKDPFQFYRSVGYGGLALYLKTEGSCPPLAGGQPRRFWPLNMKRSLKTNLKGKVLIEYPIIHVVFSSDEAYKDDCDDLSDNEGEAMQSSNDAIGIVTNEQELNEIGNERNTWSSQHGPKDDHAANTGPQEMQGDLVLSQEDAQMADPQAYKDYFDFYLKYYTQQMARQSGSLNPQLSNHDPLRPSFVGAPSIPSVNVNYQTPPCGPLLPPVTCAPAHPPMPQFSVPPPTMPNFNAPPPNYPNSSRHQPPQFSPQGGGYSNQASHRNGDQFSHSNQNRGFPNQGNNKSGGYPNRSHAPQGGYPNRSHVPSKSNTEDHVEKNLNNLDSAKKIKEELREKSVGLSSLVAYGSDSSDSE